jgi:hypothetical protein
MVIIGLFYDICICGFTLFEHGIVRYLYVLEGFNSSIFYYVDYKKVLGEGSTELFITSYFREFDPSSMSITQMPLWVHLHFWHISLMGDIGNICGNCIK